MITRTQPIFDSVQIHTALAAGAEASFFTTALNQQANQLTTATDTPYKKTDYHTNIKNNQTEKGQELFVKGFEIYSDEVDINLLAQLFFDSKAYFQFYKGDDKLFQENLAKMVKLKNPVALAIGDGQASAKAQKLGFIFPGDEGYKLDYGIVIPEQTNYKALIKFTNAVTFKKLTFDYGTLAANAAYTSPFNLFVKLVVEETKK